MTCHHSVIFFKFLDVPQHYHHWCHTEHFSLVTCRLNDYIVHFVVVDDWRCMERSLTTHTRGKMMSSHHLWDFMKYLWNNDINIHDINIKSKKMFKNFTLNKYGNNESFWYMVRLNQNLNKIYQTLLFWYSNNIFLIYRKL